MATVEDDVDENAYLLPNSEIDSIEPKSSWNITELWNKIKKPKYTTFVAICYFLNYSIGTGVLGLPRESYISGYVLSSLVLVFMGFITTITYFYVINGMLRAEAITTLCNQNGISKKTLLTNPAECQELLQGTSVAILQENYKLERNEYQLSELIGLFGGKWVRLTYDITFIIALWVALWSFCALFGESLARLIPISGISTTCDMSEEDSCRSLYSFYVCIFYVICLVLTLMDFQEQIIIQVTSSFIRCLVIGIMAIASIGLIYSNWYYNGNDYEWEPNTSGDYGPNTRAFKWSGVAYLIAVCSFAFGNQYCMTDIMWPLSDEDRPSKRQINIIIYGGVIIITVAFICCALPVSLYFGSETESICTLAFKYYMGLSYSATQSNWNTFIGWFVVLFPAIDIATAFPLNAGTTANTIEAVINQIFGRNSDLLDEPVGFGRENSTFIERLTRRNSMWAVLIRVTICTVCTGLALLVWKFDTILSISGAFGLISTYMGPVALEYYSRKYIKNITNDQDAWKTPNDQEWMTSVFWMILIMIVTTVAFIAIFVEMAE